MFVHLVSSACNNSMARLYFDSGILYRVLVNLGSVGVSASCSIIMECLCLVFGVGVFCFFFGGSLFSRDLGLHRFAVRFLFVLLFEAFSDNVLCGSLNRLEVLRFGLISVTEIEPFSLSKSSEE